jgi:hypothetical protein
MIFCHYLHAEETQKVRDGKQQEPRVAANGSGNRARRPAALGHRGARALDQGGRNSRRQRLGCTDPAHPIGDLISPGISPSLRGLPQIEMVKPVRCGVRVTSALSPIALQNLEAFASG